MGKHGARPQSGAATSNRCNSSPVPGRALGTGVSVAIRAQNFIKIQIIQALVFRSPLKYINFVFWLWCHKSS